MTVYKRCASFDNNDLNVRAAYKANFLYFHKKHISTRTDLIYIQMQQFFRLNCERSISFTTSFLLRGKAFRGAVRRVTFLTPFYHSSYYSQVSIHCIILQNFIFQLVFVSITQQLSFTCVTQVSVESRGKRVHTLSNIISTA